MLTGTSPLGHQTHIHTYTHTHLPQPPPFSEEPDRPTDSPPPRPLISLTDRAPSTQHYPAAHTSHLPSCGWPCSREFLEPRSSRPPRPFSLSPSPTSDAQDPACFLKRTPLPFPKSSPPCASPTHVPTLVHRPPRAPDFLTGRPPYQAHIITISIIIIITTTRRRRRRLARARALAPTPGLPPASPRTWKPHTPGKRHEVMMLPRSRACRLPLLLLPTQLPRSSNSSSSTHGRRPPRACRERAWRSRRSRGQASTAS